MPPCPECKSRGLKVSRVTLESLLRPERRADIGDGPYHVCATPGCQTVYFGSDHHGRFFKSDLSVVFGLKETEPPRPVCYCFDHTVEEIHDEIRRAGRSTVLERIKAEMQEPGCRCEHTNPLGACCLKSVQAVVADALRLVGREPGTVSARTVDHENCCTTQSDSRAGIAGGNRSARIAVGGSVLAAILSSACCWLPLLLIVFGTSAAGVAGFFERKRPLFLVVAAVLLAAGYYTAYVRREKCQPDSACTARNRKLRVFNRAMLWTATALVAAFAFFPNYVGQLLGAPGPATLAAADARLVAAEFHIEGMTCQGCADILRTALAKLPDVAGVDVDYANRMAVVRYNADQPVPTDMVISAVKAAGYTGTLSGDANR